MPTAIDNQDQQTLTDRKAQIRSMREKAPRKSHGQWTPSQSRPDPISLLQAQDQGRLQQLLPIKYGRMLESSFAFLRGSAVVMASDLTQSPVSGLDAIICGDAHLSNFGIFATPERRMVFDINDFDEAYYGPWEWDLKRLVASAVVAGRGNGFSEKKCRRLVSDTTKVYAYAMDKFSQEHVLDVWYYYVNVDSVLQIMEKASKQGGKSAQKLVRKASKKTHQQTIEKLTKIEDGRRQIISDPPLLVPFREMGLERYLDAEDLRHATEQRVGGVGSVGTRCMIVLLESEAEGDALILQLKEAGPSVLEAHVGKPNPMGNAQRVVTGQHLMQATSDIFLGWQTENTTGAS